VLNLAASICAFKAGCHTVHISYHGQTQKVKDAVLEEVSHQGPEVQLAVLAPEEHQTVLVVGIDVAPLSSPKNHLHPLDDLCGFGICKNVSSEVGSGDVSVSSSSSSWLQAPITQTFEVVVFLFFLGLTGMFLGLLFG
jgi:hypothetical protein